MYLINAEANARANHLPEAKAALKALLEQRDQATAAEVDNMNADQLLEFQRSIWSHRMRLFQQSMRSCCHHVPLICGNVSR